MEEAIIDWLAYRQPSRSNFHPVQGWMNDRKNRKTGEYERQATFVKRAVVYCSGNFDPATKKITLENTNRVLGSYRGLPFGAGFRVTLLKTEDLLGYSFFEHGITVSSQREAKQILKTFSREYCWKHGLFLKEVIIDF